MAVGLHSSLLSRSRSFVLFPFVTSSLFPSIPFSSRLFANFLLIVNFRLFSILFLPLSSF